MKFQLKALAVALALVAAVPAQAALTLPNTGNGSLMLTVVDRVANVSALFDLGFAYNDFNQLLGAGGPGVVGAASQSNQSWNIASNADYSAAWAQLFTSGATLPNLQFAITAVDNNGAYSAGAGAMGIISTYAGAGSALLSGALVTAAGQDNTYLGTATSAQAASLVNSFPTTSTRGAATYGSIAGVYNATGKLNNVGNFIFGSVGSTLGVEQVGTTTSGITAATTYIFPVAATFTLTSAGQLSYTTAAVAAVPEADTSAMMLAGLGLMGFIARRRNRKQA